MKPLIKAAQFAGILGVLLHSFTMPVYAAEKQRPPRDEYHFGPPEEALLACDGLAANDACTFAGPNDEMIHGVCSLPPYEDETATLACKPDKMPEMGDREPPENRED